MFTPDRVVIHKSDDGIRWDLVKTIRRRPFLSGRLIWQMLKIKHQIDRHTWLYKLTHHE